MNIKWQNLVDLYKIEYEYIGFSIYIQASRLFESLKAP